jgi:hypothetical protein
LGGLECLKSVASRNGGWRTQPEGGVLRLGRFWDPPALDVHRVRIYGGTSFALVLQKKLVFELCTPLYLVAHNSIDCGWADGTATGINVFGQSAPLPESGAIVADNDITMSAPEGTVFGASSGAIVIGGFARNNSVLAACRRVSGRHPDAAVPERRMVPRGRVSWRA